MLNIVIAIVYNIVTMVKYIVKGKPCVSVVWISGNKSGVPLAA